MDNNLQAGTCWSDIVEEQTIEGKYGDVQINGVANTTTGAKINNGCFLTYTFKSAAKGVSPKVARKTIRANVLNNGSLNRINSTVDLIYLPKSFTTVAANPSQ